MSDLIAVVMCGGKSSRMGTDKGLIHKEGKTWAEVALSKLIALNLSSKISINNSQNEAYQKISSSKELIVDEVSIPGPLAGLLSAHRKFPDADLLLLACDMIDISENTIQQLIKEYKEKQNRYDFFVFKNEKEYEPLLGTYTNKGLKKIDQLFSNGKLEKHSMKYVLEMGRTFSILVENEKVNEFKNYNEPS